MEAASDGRRRSDESGVTVIIFALSLFVLLGSGMIAVDLGNLWQTRRALVTATDATALAVAQEMAVADQITQLLGECDPTWAGLGRESAGDDTTLSCSVELTGPGTGYVVVEARRDAATFFARAFGHGAQEVYSMSAAEFGYTEAVRGLRPVALCVKHIDVAAYLAAKQVGAAEAWRELNNPVRVYFGKDGPNDCAPEPDGTDGTTKDSCGNWGWLAFDGSNASSDRARWLRDGYKRRSLAVGEHPVGSPGTAGESINTGAHGFPLSHLVDTNLAFHIGLYDSFIGGKCGSNQTYNLVGFLGVELVGHCFTGCPKATTLDGKDLTGQDARYFDFNFVEVIAQGDCCATPYPTGTVATQLCAVDYDPSGGGPGDRCGVTP